MTNNKPIFYIGTTILILILFTTVAGSTPQNYFLDDHILKFVFAQDDEEEGKEEEEESEEESKEDEEQEESESEEQPEEEQPEEEQPEQPTEEPTAEEPTNVSVVTNETIQETAQQIIEAELASAGITPNETQPVADPPAEEVIPSPPPQPIANEMQFDATCNCTTAKLPTSKPTQQPVMQPITSLPQPTNVIQQIPLTAANIQSQKSLGKVIDPIYTSYYRVANLFDNTIDDTSFWSQAGNSGFSIRFDGMLNDYRVCSIELSNIPNPKNVPFILDVGTSKNYTGVINQVNQRIQFDSCINNMNQIVMIFNKGNPQSEDFISIGEIKLFGSKLGAVTPAAVSPIPATTIPPSQQQPSYKNATKVNISNADAQIDIKNSTITFKFDPNAAQQTGYSVITIPDTRVIK